MNALTAWMEKHILPIAGKIGAQKHLVALRDAFIGTMPATMAGAIAVMINAIIRDLPPAFWPDYNGSTIPVIREIISVNGYVWNGTLAIAGLIFAFSWGFNLARAYNVNDLAGGIVALAAFIQGISFGPSSSADLGIKVPDAVAEAINNAEIGATIDGSTLNVNLWGWLKLGHLDGNAYFTIMIIGALATIIYAKLMLANITIKMPDQVPPAVSKAFAAIIPAAVALYVVAIINFAVAQITDGQLLIDLIQKYIAEPFLGLTQGFGAIVLIQVAIQIFWFFGIHGTNVMAPVLEGIFGVAQLKNINIFEQGYNGVKGSAAVLEAIKDGKAYYWVRGSFDAYTMFGGSGGTIVLLFAIFIFSKRADYLTVAKLSIGPGFFNINEPVMFGLPIVLNPIMFIPFIIAPVVTTAIGYFATIGGLVNPVSQQVPWVVPPVLLSFLATGADWRAPIVTLVCIVVSFFIWVPFVIAANKMDPSLGEPDNK
ncbi:PTS sugar transporter subunit IIC [Enterococcus sp. BWT-B8]|uniref:PTS sugar transporter subunit IIC n=1 Tax=Enterococcus sp. BWT-B8 TaxID=2885157 RepID=UPI001E2C78E1|nr:PTS sugar transporter subunit IIC [Enterococcus sp. BWT-B8]MCB5953105.1 PTS sugar transporter subunit IIC [Enterococcus sp. BWT-B8]